MTDTTPADVTPVDETTTDAAPVDAAPDYASEAEKWKAIARKNEARAKENADKAKRFDEIEEASKSELERALAKVAEAEQKAAKAVADKLRSDIAREKGVPIELLTGADEETLTAQADTLLAFKGTPPSTPSSDGQGKTGDPVSSGVKQLTREDLKSMSANEIESAEKAGQLDVLLGRA